MAAERSFSLGHTLRFAGAVCLLCSLVVSASAVVLKPRQEDNARLDRRRKVLAVAGLGREVGSLAASEVDALFTDRIQARIVTLATGAYDESIEPSAFDQRRASARPDTSQPAPPNPAGVTRLPIHAKVFHVLEEGRIGTLILPVEGSGLWSDLYGYLALAPDGNTIRGITFYEHGETPGLGGDIDRDLWRALWVGRRAFDDTGSVAIEVIRGRAGSAAADPYRVDGISGATLTCRGVTELLHFWLGPDGFGPYLERLRQGGGSS